MMAMYACMWAATQLYARIQLYTFPSGPFTAPGHVQATKKNSEYKTEIITQYAVIHIKHKIIFFHFMYLIC